MIIMYVFDSFKKEYNEIVTKLYREILLREPDEEGLIFYVESLKTKQKSVSEIKEIFYNSEEAKRIRNYTPYVDKFWNDLETVKKYKRKLATGNENLTWFDSIKTAYADLIPFKKVLIVGCGNGWVERKLFDKGIGIEFDAFDISEKYLLEAKEKKGNRTINYFVEDVNSMNSIEENKYDAVFNYAILHHVYEIDFAIKKLSKVLKPNGLMFNEEYIGPAQIQFSDSHLHLIENVMNSLPEKYRTKYPLRPAIENFRVDPTESVHSDLIKHTFSKYFDITIDRPMNGGIAYTLLWNNIKQFENPNDLEAKKWLDFILEKDSFHTKNGDVPVLFWYGVGTPKQS